MNALEWHVLTGCSFISTGCANCYAVQRTAVDPARHGLTKPMVGGTHAWTGRIRLNRQVLTQPVGLTAPTFVYVANHSDLFHENGDARWVDAVFKVMEQCPQHVFYLATKRAKRMRDYVNGRYLGTAAGNIWFGVSVERQHEADQRIPMLLETRGGFRFVSCYPLLGPLDLGPYLKSGGINCVLAGQEDERPAKPEWTTAIEQACAGHNIKYHFGTRLS